MKSLYQVLAIIISIFLSQSAHTKSLWKDKNIYSASENLQVGDILVLNIDDISQMNFNLTLNNKNSFSISSIPDTNITPFLPNVSSDKTIDRGDNINISGKGNLKISIASRITERLNDGKHRIAGFREYIFKDTTNRFIVSGIIDQASVNGRIIRSSDVADFRLEIDTFTKGSGMKIKKQKLEEGKSTVAELSEEEKEKLIMDYLERMLNELSR